MAIRPGRNTPDRRLGDERAQNGSIRWGLYAGIAVIVALLIFLLFWVMRGDEDILSTDPVDQEADVSSDEDTSPADSTFGNGAVDATPDSGTDVIEIESEADVEIIDDPEGTSSEPTGQGMNDQSSNEVTPPADAAPVIDDTAPRASTDGGADVIEIENDANVEIVDDTEGTASD